MSTEVTTLSPTSKPKQLKAFLVIGALASIGAACGFLTTRLFTKDQLGLLRLESPGLVLISILPILFMVLAVHELGHVFGGWLSGHRFYMLVVGPLRVTKTPSGLRWSLNRNVNMFGGLAICFPHELENFQRRRFVLVALGPLASVALTIASAFLVRFLAQWDSNLAISNLRDLAIITAMLSALISLVTLVPYPAGGFPSDGGQMLGLLRGDARWEQVGLVMLVYNLSVSGVRPRDWDAKPLLQASRIKSGNAMYDAAPQLMLYSYYLDRGDLSQAQSHLENSLTDYDGMAQGMKQGFALEAAYFAACHLKDLDKATTWLVRGQGGIVDPATRSRAEAAVLMLQGKSTQALEKIKLARTQLARSIDRGSSEAELDLLQEIEDQLTIA